MREAELEAARQAAEGEIPMPLPEVFAPPTNDDAIKDFLPLLEQSKAPGQK